MRLLVLLAACSSGGSTGPEVECGAAGVQVLLPSDQPIGCTRMLGSVHLPDSVSRDDLAPLREVRRIDGDFTIFRNHSLEDLEDLAALRTVGGTFSVRFDDGLLDDLDGLVQLREVGALELQNNTGLASLRGLEQLESVTSLLAITGNTQLPQAEIDALLARVEVGGPIVVEANGP
jgi:hypothetical protein